MQSDPTHTVMLRLQYVRQLTRLFKRFRKIAIPQLVDAVINYQTKYGKIHSMKTIRTLGISNDIDVWLEMEINRDIIEPSKYVINRNVTQAYTKGANKASQQLHALVDLEMMEGLTAADWDALLILQDINFNRIKDCTTVMKNSITYSCSRGILEGWGATKTAYELRRAVNGNSQMGIVRAKMIARTEIINAYNTAAQNKYKQMGVKKYEWITGWTDRTCDVCAGYDGQVFTIGHDPVPPIHPNCGCATHPIIETPR